ncbi:melatonin receptor type 1B-B-like [Amphiura filiformis]|uniref:melatonin receptor type 1B-B-like n=1 Tax=Amphiura filiformis TaxID=82378 RepID=UPI003B226DC2
MKQQRHPCMVSTEEHEEGELNVPKAVTYVYVPIMIFVSCVGVVGNILVVGAVVKRKQLRVLINVFIVNLAVADFVVSILVNPFAVVGVLDKGNLFQRFPALCEVLATFCVIGFVGSLWSLSFVALNRYVYICHRFYYPKVFTSKTVAGMIAFIWIFALLLDLPNYLGWGDHDFDIRNYTCCYTYSANFGYTRGFLLVFGFILPVGLLNYSYIRIYLLARKSSKKMAAHQENISTSPTRSNIEASDRRLLLTIGVIWLVFMIMWSPYAISVIFDLGDITALFIPGTLMAFMNSSGNCLIYATNRNFRKGYKMIFKGMICCRRQSQMNDGVRRPSSVDAISSASKDASRPSTSATNIITSQI